MRAVFDLYDSTHSNTLGLGELTSMLDDLGLLKAQANKTKYCTRIFSEYSKGRSEISFASFQALYASVERSSATRLLHIDLPSKSSQAGRRLDELMRMPATPLRLDGLFEAGKVNSPEQHLKNAQFLHRELMVRRAGLLRALTLLPCGLAQHPSVVAIAGLYRRLLAQLLRTSPPSSADEEWIFESRLRTTFITHTEVPAAIGTALFDLSNADGAAATLTPQQQKEIDRHLDCFFLTRIGVRFLVAQYLASKEPEPGWVGNIQFACSPVAVCRDAAADVRGHCLERFGACPPIEVIGDVEHTFAFVPAHVRFVVTELIENSCEATLRHHGPPELRDADVDAAATTAPPPQGPSASSDGLLNEQQSCDASRALPPVRVVIVAGESDVSIKVEDQGGGFARSRLRTAWSYVGSRRLIEGHGSLGLPLSRLYAKYFGGTLHVTPMEGYGTDAYVRFHQISSNSTEACAVALGSAEPSEREIGDSNRGGLFDAQARR